MWASNGRRAELVIESRDGSAMSEDIKSFLAAASVPLFPPTRVQPSLNEFPGKNCRRDLLSLFIYHEIYFRLCGWSFSGRSDMKCFFSDSLLAKAAQRLSLTQMLEMMKYWLALMKVRDEIIVYLLCYILVGLSQHPADLQSEAAWEWQQQSDAFFP